MLTKSIQKRILELTKEEIEALNQNRLDFYIYSDNSNSVINIDKFISDNDLITARKHTRFVEFPNHRHDFVEIQYVYSGNITQICDGKVVHINSGEIVFLNQNVEHKINRADKDDIMINLLIKPKFFKYIISLASVENKLFNFLLDTIYKKDKKSEILHFKVSEIREIQESMAEIITELYEPSENKEIHDLLIKLNVAKLFTLLIKHIDKLEINTVDAYEAQILFKVINYIDKNFEHGSLNQLSEQMDIPTYKLSRFVKSSTGSTFGQLMQSKKMDKAINLLIKTDLPIEIIVNEIGYENISYFYKIFKRDYGLTPLEFRERHGIINDK